MAKKKHNHLPNKQLKKLFKKARDLDDKHAIGISGKETEADFQRVAQKSGLNRQKKRRSAWMYAAAALVLMGALGIAYLLTPHRIQVADGAIQRVSLPDGTVVTMNGGATLTYPRWFGYGGRTVSLNGEAFFEVPHTGASFQVKAGRARITVMGTKFNVCSRSTGGGRQTMVFLKKGRVKFLDAHHSEQAVILKPGESSVISPQHPGPTPPQQNDSANTIAWLHQGLSFTDQPLSAIVATVSRRFGVTITISPNKLKREKLTIYLAQVKSANQTIADICRTKGLTYTRKGDTFIISKPL